MLTAARALTLNARSAPKLPEIPAFRDIYARGAHPRRGELVMIVGRPGSQKSGFALYWTATMNLPTLYFSADMNGFQYSSRLAGIMGGYTTEQCERMMRGSRTEQEQLLRSVEGLNMISSFETPIRWESISYQLEAYVELHNAYPEVMVFDNLMDFEGGESDYSLQMENLQILDEMKRETGSTIIVLHHATDKGDSAKKDPRMPPPRNEVKGGLAEKPELVFGVGFDPGGYLNVAVLKNRNGPCDPSAGDYVRLKAMPETTRFASYN